MTSEAFKYARRTCNLCGILLVLTKRAQRARDRNIAATDEVRRRILEHEL